MLKMKNGRFWVEKKDFEILIKYFPTNRLFLTTWNRSRSSKHGFLIKNERKSGQKKIEKNIKKSYIFSFYFD